MEKLVVGSCQESEEPSCVVKLFEAFEHGSRSRLYLGERGIGNYEHDVVTIAIKITTAGIRTRTHE
jgi:hypothetical protein